MFERAYLTVTLCDLLRSANGVVSYERIIETAGKPLDEIRQTLTNVRRYLERDEGIVFETVRNEGLRRLTDSEKVSSATKFSRAIHRTAGKGVTRINAVSDFAALSNEDQLSATIRKTMFEAVKRETNADRKG